MQQDVSTPAYAGWRVGVVLFLWFTFSVTVFAIFYWQLSMRFSNEEHLAKILSNIGWPYAALSLSGPVVYLLSTNMRHLLGLKKTIDEAPEKLGKIFADLRDLDKNIEEISAQAASSSAQAANSINASIDDIVNSLSGLEEQLKRNTALAKDIPADQWRLQEADTSPTLRERLANHVEAASQKFYQALERANNDGRRKDILVVNRGGGNRPELVEKLKQGRLYLARDESTNSAIAEYLIATFKAEITARKGNVDESTIVNLDELKKAASIT
jgi:hypothetical protein